jgi:hypothetical protein
MMRDTNAWIFQVWSAAALSVFASLYGIFELSGINFKLMTACLFVCMYVSITLQKMIRDNQSGRPDTLSYKFVTWAGLAFALYFTWSSIRDLGEIDVWHRNYLIVTFLFVVSSVFVLTKTVRDQADYEAMHEGKAHGKALEEKG